VTAIADAIWQYIRGHWEQLTEAQASSKEDEYYPEVPWHLQTDKDTDWCSAHQAFIPAADFTHNPKKKKPVKKRRCDLCVAEDKFYEPPPDGPPPAAPFS